METAFTSKKKATEQQVANIHTPAQEEECWLSYATRGMELRRIGVDEEDSANEMLRRSVEISTEWPEGLLRITGSRFMIVSWGSDPLRPFGAKEIRPKLLARNASEPLHIEHPVNGNFLPLGSGATRQTECEGKLDDPARTFSQSANEFVSHAQVSHG
jgi:hypothetical protein